VTLVRASTFQKAAEKLYISQSSLSNNIQSIEREVGVSLISRETRGLALTEAGRLFFDCSEKIVNEYERMSKLIQGYKQGGQNRVSIYTDILCSYGYDSMLVRFNAMVPEIQTEVTEIKNLSHDHAMIPLNNAVGILFSKDNEPGFGLKSHTLVKDTIAVLVGESHRLAKRCSIHMHDLRDEVLQIVVRDQSAFLFELLMEQCDKSGFTPKTTQYSLWYSSICEIVRKLGVIAVIPAKVAQQYCRPGLRMINIIDADPFYINIVISSESTHTAALRFFEFAESA
jgi:DNA-binding transcriptional LysR family regulator